MATIDYSKVYDEYNKAKEYELQQQATALQKQVDEYSAQKSKIDQNYTDAANTAYTDARLTSRGRAENLAAMGLGRGYYDDPSSGYAERQISRADSDLRNTLGKIDLEKAGKLTDVDNYIAQLNAAAKANSYGIEASYAQKIAALQKQEAEARAQYEMELKQLANNSNNNDDLPISSSNFNYAKTLYAMNNNKGAYDTIYSALLELDPSFRYSNPDAFKNAMLKIVNRIDGSYENTYQFNNWWYKTILGDQHNGWGMNW